MAASDSEHAFVWSEVWAQTTPASEQKVSQQDCKSSEFKDLFDIEAFDPTKPGVWTQEWTRAAQFTSHRFADLSSIPDSLVPQAYRRVSVLIRSFKNEWRSYKQSDVHLNRAIKRAETGKSHHTWNGKAKKCRKKCAKFSTLLRNIKYRLSGRMKDLDPNFQDSSKPRSRHSPPSTRHAAPNQSKDTVKKQSTTVVETVAKTVTKVAKGSNDQSKETTKIQVETQVTTPTKTQTTSPVSVQVNDSPSAQFNQAQARAAAAARQFPQTAATPVRSSRSTRAASRIGSPNRRAHQRTILNSILCPTQEPVVPPSDHIVESLAQINRSFAMSLRPLQSRLHRGLPAAPRQTFLQFLEKYIQADD